MKALFITTLFVCAISFGTLGQDNNADSLKLKRDIESIKNGEEVKPSKKQSILHRDTSPVKIDTAALKPDLPQPTPTHPNNPNPHEPVPSPVNPNPPDTPTSYPQVPKAAPKGQDIAPIKKTE